MGKPRRGQPAVFSPSEIEHMEKLVLEKKLGLLDRSFCQQIVKEFNRSSGRVGSKVIQIYQVQEWFENKLRNQESEVTYSPFESRENAIASDTSLSNNVPEISSDVAEDEKDKMPDLDKLDFEARSSRDYAWYDINTFLAHRVGNGEGEVEVKVRYEGFGADEDEWVNVRRAVRVRSIPVESSECIKVRAGDLVLCFREGNNEAVHYDAHVIEIERKLHDVRGCRCLFLVRYDHDETEEKVHLSRLCRRPRF